MGGGLSHWRTENREIACLASQIIENETSRTKKSGEGLYTYENIPYSSASLLLMQRGETNAEVL